MGYPAGAYDECYKQAQRNCNIFHFYLLCYKLFLILRTPFIAKWNYFTINTAKIIPKTNK